MTVKQCDNCQFFVANREGECAPVCAKLHKPRFIGPKSPVDTDYGYRRTCDDFEQRQEVSPLETIVSVRDFVKLFDSFPDLNDGRSSKEDHFDRAMEWYSSRIL